MRRSAFCLLAIVAPIWGIATTSNAHASLIGTDVTFGTLFQQTATSRPVAISTTATVPVSATVVEFPSLAAFGVANNLGLFIVNAAVDITAQGLTQTFQNAGRGVFATAFENDGVYTFESSALVNITGAVVDPSSNLGLTNADLTFSGNQLFINYGGGESFGPNSRLQIDLVVQGGPTGIPVSTSVAEPDTLEIFGAGLCFIALIVSAGHWTLGRRG
jgi:hypothetical protein